MEARLQIRVQKGPPHGSSVVRRIKKANADIAARYLEREMRGTNRRHYIRTLLRGIKLFHRLNQTMIVFGRFS